MSMRSAYALAVLVAIGSTPATSRSDDAAALAAVGEVLGPPPRTLRVTAAGSEYARPAAGSGATHERIRIASYTLELDLAAPAAEEGFVRAGPTAADGSGETAETRTVDTASPWARQYRLWTTPYAFLAGAAAAADTRTSEAEVAGVSYVVVSFTPARGERVRGYINDENVVERTQTEFSDPVRGDVEFEASYLDWAEFDGIRYPTIVIEKENGALHRVLIVQKVERDANVDAAPLPPSSAA